MHPGLMAVPGGGASSAPGAPGAGGAGAAVGADVLSQRGEADEGSADPDPYAVPLNEEESFPPRGDGGSSQSTNDAGPSGEGSEWATFEEPDHGFQEPYADDNAWSGDDEGFSSDLGGIADGDGEGGRGLLRSIMDIFFDND